MQSTSIGEGGKEGRREGGPTWSAVSFWNLKSHPQRYSSANKATLSNPQTGWRRGLLLEKPWNELSGKNVNKQRRKRKGYWARSCSFWKRTDEVTDTCHQSWSKLKKQLKASQASSNNSTQFLWGPGSFLQGRGPVSSLGGKWNQQDALGGIGHLTCWLLEVKLWKQ